MALPTFSFETTAQDAASVLKDQITGKNVLITGTSVKSLGLEAARAIAPYANLVVITGYNAERTLTLDLSSLASVRKAAAEVNAYSEPLHGPPGLDYIHNNAATMGSFYLTDDGFEIQAATAQFGPFLFTKLLTPKLLASATTSYVPRVVYVSSVAHALGITGIDWSKLRTGYPAEEANKPDGMMKRYAEVKTMNMLTALELSRRANGKLRAYSLHPGTIYTNAFDKEALLPLFVQYGAITEDFKPKENPMFKWKTLPQGAATPARILSMESLPPEQVAPHAADLGNAEKLWTLTEEIVGEKWEL
ncbi:Short-chain dehydrogenase/reductase family protein [Mycena chlorophos]|uniref:Short-chain dehydrogenase/reductase family protein n=1 Tax=Mycena chlorophos TaxID=658473 RepID=A0A8H6S7H7_MYCCL|nr:Short-chain dehydrogenase/reductase family protein [Mycena chlorophos]